MEPHKPYFKKRRDIWSPEESEWPSEQFESEPCAPILQGGQIAYGSATGLSMTPLIESMEHVASAKQEAISKFRERILIDMLTSRVNRLEASIERQALSSQVVFNNAQTYPIGGLEEFGYKLTRPLSAFIEMQAEDHFVATELETQISASECTLVDSIHSLREMIVLTYESLSGHPDDKLSSSMKLKCKLLMSLVVPTDE